MKNSTRYAEARHWSHIWTWLSRTLAAIATAVAMIGVGVVAVAPAGSASEGPSGETVAASDIDRAATVAKARAGAALMEQRRIEELMGQGLSRPEASAQLLTEQKAAAKQGRLRILELTMRGMTPQEIADTTPGLVLASTESSGPAPLSSNGDLELYRGTRYFYMQCSCDTLNAEWRHINDLENDAQDAVGIRVTESVQNLGGSIYHCDTNPSPDQCHVDGSVDYEDPNGVAHDFSSEEGERGVISFSARQYSSDGPGPCQMFSHYVHAWSSVQITGYTISTDNFTVNISSVDDRWSKRAAGPGVAC